MKKPILDILLVKTVGRYKVIIFNAGAARLAIKEFLEKRYNGIQLHDDTISFGLEVHENPQEVAEQISELYNATLNNV